MKNKYDIALYLVKTDMLLPEDGVIRETDYRVLATSVTEAVQIVEECANTDLDEKVIHCQEISHITGLPSNRYYVEAYEKEAEQEGKKDPQ